MKTRIGNSDSGDGTGPGSQGATSRLACCVLAVLCSCLCVPTKADGISIVSQKLTYRTLTSAQADFDMAVLEMTFDGPIAVRGLGAPALSLLGLNGSDLSDRRFSQLTNSYVLPSTDPNAPPTIVPGFLFASGIGSLNCTMPNGSHTIFHTDVPISAGSVPTGMLVVEPSDTPAPSLLKALGGLALNPGALHDNRLAFAIPLNGTIFQTPFFNHDVDRATFDTWLCTMNLSPSATHSNGLSLVDVNRNQIINTTSGVWRSQPNACNLQGLLNMTAQNNFIQELLTQQASNTASPQYINALHLAANIPSLYEAYAGCKALLESMYNTSDTITAEVNVLNTTSDAIGNYVPINQVSRCQFSVETDEWKSSPCCNPFEYFSGCCAPGDVTKSVAPIARTAFNVTSDSVVDVVATQAILKSYAEAKQASDIQNLSPKPIARDEWLSMNTALVSCQSGITVESCHVDTDCHYNTKCNQANGLCFVNWGNVSAALSRCIIDKGDVRVLRKMYDSFNIDVNSPTLADDLAAQFDAVATDVDCIGPHSASYRNSLNTTYDHVGVANVTILPGNQALCETEVRCNWNPAISDSTSCVGPVALTAMGDHFCGLPTDGTGGFLEHTELPRCWSGDLWSSAGIGPGGSAYATGTACLASRTDANWVPTAAGGTSRVNGCSFSAGATASACYDPVLSPLCAPLVDYLTNTTALLNRTLVYDPILVQGIAPRCSSVSSTLTGVSVGDYPLISPSKCYSTDPTVVTQSICLAMGVRAANTTYALGFGTVVASIGLNFTWNPIYASCEGSFGVVNRFDDPSLFLLAGSLNQTTCNIASSAFHPTGRSDALRFNLGVVFTPGKYHTANLCSLGTCSNAALNYSGVGQTQCASTNTCGNSCGKCASPLHTPPFLSSHQGACLRNDGLCSQAFQTIGGASVCIELFDRHACTYMSGKYPSRNYVYYGCEDIVDEAVCTPTGVSVRSGSSAFNDSIYRNLSCYWSHNEACLGESECRLSAFHCQDDETTSCVCDRVMGCSCTQGSCIEEWFVNATTGARRNCLLGAVGIVQTDIGCKNTSVVTRSDCEAKGGNWVWHIKAFNQSACSAHGTTCPNLISDNYGAVLSRPGSQCTGCGADSVPDKYLFGPGVVVPSAFLPLAWTPRLWTSVNNWKRGLSFAKLELALRGFTSTAIQETVNNNINAQHARLINLFHAIQFQTDPHAIADPAGALAVRTSDPVGATVWSSTCDVPWTCPQSINSGTPIALFSCTVCFTAGADSVHLTYCCKHPGEDVALCYTDLAEQAYLQAVLAARGASAVSTGQCVTSVQSVIPHGTVLANQRLSQLIGTRNTSTTSGTSLLSVSALLRSAANYVASGGASSASDDTAEGILVPGTNYDIVVSATDASIVVGQIVGNGLQFQINATVGTINLCVPISQAIPLNFDSYPIRDFGVVQPPNGIVPVMTGISQNGVTFCGNIDVATVCPGGSISTSAVGSCTVFPILRFEPGSSGLSTLDIVLIAVFTTLGAIGLAIGGYFLYQNRMGAKAAKSAIARVGRMNGGYTKTGPIED